MAYRKTMKVVLSATRQSLERLPWLGFTWPEDEIVGAAMLKAEVKKFSIKHCEVAGRLLCDQLVIMTDKVEQSCEDTGPFIYSIDNKTSFLEFIRQMRTEFKRFGELDHMKLDLQFQLVKI